METQSRAQQIVATLEQQLASCHAALGACLKGRAPDELLSEWPLKRMLSLMKMSAQLASTIGRLDARAAAKNPENSGSITQ